MEAHLQVQIQPFFRMILDQCVDSSVADECGQNKRLLQYLEKKQTQNTSHLNIHVFHMEISAKVLFILNFTFPFFTYVLCVYICQKKSFDWYATQKTAVQYTLFKQENVVWAK